MRSMHAFSQSLRDRASLIQDHLLGQVRYFSVLEVRVVEVLVVVDVVLQGVHFSEFHSCHLLDVLFHHAAQQETSCIFHQAYI